MRHVLLLSAAPVLLGLAISPVEARGGGGGGFGGGHAGFGFHSGFHSPALHLGVNRARPVISQRFIRNPSVMRNHLHAGRFPGRRFTQNGVPFADGWVGGIPFGWGWPDQAAQVGVPESQPIQPQVIVIRSDPSGRQIAQDTQGYGYVPGCHPIPNGYHCDAQ